MATHASGANATTVCAGTSILQGVDVSSFNGAIDWSAVASGGKTFAYARVSVGTTFVDGFE